MSLSHIFYNTWKVFILNGLALACGLGKNIILGRLLTETELGIYSLVLTIVGFVYPLSLVGQQTALVRFLNDKTVDEFALRSYLVKVFAISISINVLGAFAGFEIYAITFTALFFVLFVSFSSAANDIIPAILRVKGYFATSMFIFRGVNYFLMLYVLFLYYHESVEINTVLIGFICIFLLFTFTIVYFSRNIIAAGKTKIPPIVWHDGFIFLGTDLSLLVITSIDRLIIPKIISLEALGLYFAINAILRIFDLLFQSIEFVLIPQIQKIRKKQIILISAITFIAGAALFLIYIFLGPLMVDLAYNGKYNAGFYLIPLLCISRFIRLLYSIPYSIISGKLGTHRLKQLFNSNIVTMVVSIIVSIILIHSYGLMGAAISTAFVWGIRLLFLAIILWMEKNTRG
ncbi:MAG: hypothetical protein DWQ05_07930 [Calditrichaeota bacterium]|nr:MAG: hypothetical protein DWQ05_07930 [Calditrichota bacterium]